MKTRFLQSDFWADFKANHGWKQAYADGVSVLTRRFSKFGALSYVPLAPEQCHTDLCSPNGEHFKAKTVFSQRAEGDVSSGASQVSVIDIDAYVSTVANLTEKIKKLSTVNSQFSIRYDFPLDFATVEEKDEFTKNFLVAAKNAKLKIKKTRVDVQPPDTVLIDLKNADGSGKTPDELLAAMKSKWRYNIRLAEKKGVTVRKVNAASHDFEKDLDSFYEIYKTTASRDGIGLHPKSYYKDLIERGTPNATVGSTPSTGLWKLRVPLVESSGAGLAEVSTRSSDRSFERALEAPTKVYLYIASHENEDLAAIVVLFCPRETVYLYGCSSNNKRNLMPAYLLQWTAINDALSYGSDFYDFYGIPPTNDENHPMHGLYLFKTGFGGREVHRPGSFDVPVSFIYNFYTAAENLRAFWHKKVLKKIRGR